MLTAVIRFLLLIGVVVGLSSQSVASASTPCPVFSTAPVGATASMPDCAAMADMAKGEIPAKKMRPGCMTMAGCIASVAFEVPVFDLHAPLYVKVAALSEALSIFSGRDIAPEPEPPAS